MKQNNRPIWLRILIVFIIGLSLGFVSLLAVGFLNGSYTGARGKALSDACLLPGALFTTVGTLSWVASKGFFDLAGYATFSLFGFFIPRFTKEEDRSHSLYDYKVKKDEKGRYWLPHVLIIGLVFLAASILIAYLVID